MTDKKVTVPYLTFRPGEGQGVPETDTAIFRYNSEYERVEVSVNGGPYHGFVGRYDGYLYGELLSAPNVPAQLDGYVAYIDSTSTELNKVTIQQILALASGSGLGAPGGNQDSIQFNDGGLFSGSDNFKWDSESYKIFVSDGVTSSEFSATGVDATEAFNINSASASAWNTSGGTSDITLYAGGKLKLKADDQIEIGTETSPINIRLLAQSVISPAVSVSGATGYVGIGGTAASRFSVGNSKFQINDSGNIVKVNNVSISFPSGQGLLDTTLRNDGFGNLSWVALTNGTVTSVKLDAGATGLTISGGSSQTITSSGTFLLAGTLSTANGGTNASSWTEGGLVFAGLGGTSLTQDSTKLFWSNGSNALGIRTNSPVAGSSVDIASGQLAIHAGSAATPAFAFRNNLANGIFSPGVDQIAISTAAAQRMVVDASGNIGIATTSPTSLFSVAEKFKINSNGNIVLVNNLPTIFPSSPGGAGTILTNNGSGTLSWEYASGPDISPIQTKFSAYTLTGADGTILADATGGGFSITLPLASSASGQVFSIKKKDISSNIVTVATTNTDKIDGAAQYLLQTQYELIRVQSDGSSWWIL